MYIQPSTFRSVAQSTILAQFIVTDWEDKVDYDNPMP
jgi:hypothetical protein